MSPKGHVCAIANGVNGSMLKVQPECKSKHLDAQTILPNINGIHTSRCTMRLNIMDVLMAKRYNKKRTLKSSKNKATMY